MFSGAGPVSSITRDLFFEAIALMLIVVVPVFLFTLFVIWRYRKSCSAVYRPDWDRSPRLEITIWLAPLIIVMLLGWLVWHRTHQLDPYKLLSGERPLLVQAVSLDWQWLFIYPDEGIAAVNELVIPAGRPVRIQLTSDTVMSALSIPALAGQIYAMAGMTTELNLEATEPGSFLGRNSQFSGDGFSAQTFTTIATDAEGFERFLREARADNRTLDIGKFDQLAKPTTAGPVQYYGRVMPHIFKSVLARHMAMPEREGHVGHP